MPLAFLKKLLTPTRPNVSRTDWEKIVDAVSAEFRDCRADWFTRCVRLIEGVRHPSLDGRAEVAISVYQCILALEFIAERRYIEPADGREFANQLLAGITEGQNSAQVHEIYKQLHRARNGDNKGGDIFLLCSEVVEHVQASDKLSATMGLAGTIPLFTNIINSVVASAFGDTQTAARLEQLRKEH